MRILFTTVGAYGHFHPIAPLALATAGRGHDVTVASERQFAPWIRACGLPVVSAGHAPAAVRRSLPELAARHPRLTAAHGFLAAAAAPMFADLLPLARSALPDVIVHEEGEFAAPLVGAVLGIPCVTHSWSAPARPPDERAAYETLLEPLWRVQRSGTPKLCGDRYLDACPPPAQAPGITWATRVTRIRPVVFDGPPARPPEWVHKIARPAAYITLGTVRAFSSPELLRLAVEALRPVVASVVVTTGPNPPGLLGGRRANVYSRRYVRQSHVLPHVDLVVSHGGAGTTLGCIRHRLPHLVIPAVSPSQRRNAVMTQSLGIGTCLSRPQASVRSIRHAATPLLVDGLYRQRVAAVAATIDRLPPPEAVVDLLEELVG